MADLPVIEFRDVTKRYADCVAVNRVSLSVPQGTVLALLGPSGCGKTTTLRLVAGLEAPDSGEIWLNGQIVAGRNGTVPPEARRVGMVFQDYALFPHLNVASNIGFGLGSTAASDRKGRVASMLDLVGLPDLASRHPHQLSGGQQQRIALARALAANPAVVLLDEPFSNLDAALRKIMREEVRQILRTAGATAVFVTHDQEEALSIADLVAVMITGEIVQIDTPQEVYLRPARREVAAFVGETNFVPGDADGKNATCALGRVMLHTHAVGRVDVMIRPEQVILIPDPAGSARIVSVQFLGHDQIVHLAMGDLKVLARTRARVDLAPGMAVRLNVHGPVMVYPTSK